MLKDTTYQEKFKLLDEWLPNIIETTKKDLRNDHLRQDPGFIKKYLSNKNFAKITSEELAEGYRNALAQEEKVEELGEFIANRWLLKHSDIYHFFEERLVQINPNFTELSELDTTSATTLMEESIAKFGALKTYLFSVINSVVFPNAVYQQLKKRSQEEKQQHDADHKLKEEARSLADLKNFYEQQLARQADRYDKKIMGLQKKYINDTEALKKQLVALQRKLSSSPL